MQDLTFSLDPLPPFRLDLTAWALRRRPVNAIDSWDGEAYSRVLAIDGRPVFIRIIQSRGLRSPRLESKPWPTASLLMQSSRSPVHWRNCSVSA